MNFLPVALLSQHHHKEPHWLEHYYLFLQEQYLTNYKMQKIKIKKKQNKNTKYFKVAKTFKTGDKTGKQKV